MSKLTYGNILQGAIVLFIACAQAVETNTSTLPLASSLATNLLFDQVVAKSKSFQIKRSQVDEICARYGPANATNRQLGVDDKRATLEAKILDKLIVNQLLINRSNADDKARAKKTYDNLLSQRIKSAITEDAFARQLANRGMTLEKYKVTTMESIICAAVLDREVKFSVQVTDAQAKKFYEDSGRQFDEPQHFRVSQILIATRNQATGAELSEAAKKEKRLLAETILDRARKGEDFAKLAKAYSDDADSSDKGGEYVFSRGGIMAKIENAVISLQEGKISDLVTSPNGYYIIKLSERLPIKKMAFAAVSDNIKAQLRQEAWRKRLEDYIAKLKKEDGVEIVDANAIGIR